MQEPAIPFAVQVKFERGDMIITYRAADPLKRKFFCYIRCNLAGFTRMKNDFANKVPAIPAEYGKVIYLDYMENPDTKAEEFLQNWLKENS